MVCVIEPDDTVGAVSVGPDDVTLAAQTLCDALAPAVDSDWTIGAAHVDWSCEQTLDHVINALFTYAAHLASRAERGLPHVRGPMPLTPSRLLRVTGAAAAVLVETARAAPADIRAYHPAAPADPEDFAPWAATRSWARCRHRRGARRAVDGAGRFGAEGARSPFPMGRHHRRPVVRSAARQRADRCAGP